MLLQNGVGCGIIETMEKDAAVIYSEARLIIVEELRRRGLRVSAYSPEEIKRAAYELIDRLDKLTEAVNPTYPKHWAD